MFPGAVFRDKAHEERREVSKSLNLALMLLHRLLPEIKRDLGGGIRFGQPRADFGATGFGQRAAHAAGNSPRRMDFFVAENFDDLLAELARADAGAGQIL